MKSKNSRLSYDQHILNNLFSFWRFVGTCSGQLYVEENYHAVHNPHADWPNRVFLLTETDTPTFVSLVRKMKAGDLPDRLTIPENHRNVHHARLVGLILKSRQRGMFLTSAVNEHKSSVHSQAELTEVKNYIDCIRFAVVASRAFGYRIDFRVIEQIASHPDRVRLYIGQRNSVTACCGLIYSDESGNAGLHMIGTAPEFRGKGLARMMTIRLLDEFRMSGKTLCVLQASEAGENIYSDLGFTKRGFIETYQAHTPNTTSVIR